MQKVIRYILSVLLIGFLFVNDILGQVSDGGSPMPFFSTKSTGRQFVELPAPEESAINAVMEKNNNGTLKAFRFALPIEVDLSPENSGEWYHPGNGYNIWRLTIASANAKSLIVLFDQFELSAGARLFLFSESEDYYLGAYTSLNNKKSGKFAVSPVIGEEVTIQYEVPEELGEPSDFRIFSVNHDFVGIFKSSRRPLQIAGSCNIDINCEIGANYSELKNAICRLIVSGPEGSEICSGTLLNNTAEDQKPYVISAAHCYDSWDLAETTVFTFNYESPYCAPLDGDPLHSISGAVMHAKHDSLDFALAEMSLIPPPDYRPYYAGWSHSAILPDSTVSIHHPWGDIKKIAIDNDPPVKSNFGSNAKYTKGAFLHIEEWEGGVTEKGSSGGGLFNTKGQLIGTLSGGNAKCGDPFDDFYASFAVYWDYRSDFAKQLKHWLDPLNQMAPYLEGRNFYEDENLCKAFTNLTDDDEHGNVRLIAQGNFSGYWGGTNSVGIDEIVERFSVPGNENLIGVSLGVGKIVRKSTQRSEITVKVYNGNQMPESMIYSKVVNVGSLAADAMNYIAFDQDVQPAETFFVGFELSNVQPQDTFVLYQSLRSSNRPNEFYFKLDGQWVDFSENAEGSMANVMELVACNYNEIINDTPVVDTPQNVWIYPNPARTELTVQSDQEIMVETISVFNLLGQEVKVPLLEVHSHQVKLDLTGNTPGVYVVRFNYNDSFVTRKFSLVPY